VRENFQFYGGIYGLSVADIKLRTAQMLEELQLTHIRNKILKEIPLGWKQKLAFSVAMIHQPKLIFLDEPTGGVDPLTRRQFWEMIYQAAEKGVTIFVTTHYMDEAEYCERVSIMVDGRIEALDTPAALKKTYQAHSMNEVFIQLARKGQTNPEK
jgi:ABC-2 type transport system ATP-binding protein